MKVRVLGVLLFLCFGVMGCALLQETPPIEIPACAKRVHLSCPEEKSPKWLLSFAAVEDKRAQRIEGTLPVKFQIERSVLYVRLTANAVEDSDNVSHGNEIGELRIPLKGAAIREIKFYGR